MDSVMNKTQLQKTKLQEKFIRRQMIQIEK